MALLTNSNQRQQNTIEEQLWMIEFPS